MNCRTVPAKGEQKLLAGIIMGVHKISTNVINLKHKIMRFQQMKVQDISL